MNEEYNTIPFKVWHIPGVHAYDSWDISFVRVEKNTHSWGCCISETCMHNSHDPYREGHTIYILCKYIGKNEKGHDTYITSKGITFQHVKFVDGNRAYAPVSRLEKLTNKEIKLTFRGLNNV